MSVLLICSVLDKAVGGYATPFVSRTKFEAIRSFEQGCNDRQSGTLFTNPEDFSLYAVGQFDDQVGLLVPFKEPERLITALECRRKDIEAVDPRQVGLAQA